MSKHFPQRLLGQSLEKSAGHLAQTPLAGPFVLLCVPLLVVFLLAQLTRRTDLCLQSRAGQPGLHPHLRAHLLDSKGNELPEPFPLLRRGSPQGPILAPSSPRQKLEWMPQKVLKRIRSQTEVQSGHMPPPTRKPAGMWRVSRKFNRTVVSSPCLRLGIGCHQNAAVLLNCHLSIHSKFSSRYWLFWRRPWKFKGGPIWRPRKVFHTVFLWFYSNKKN